MESIAATKPDLAIFDIHLKGGNSLDALAEAKRLVASVMSNGLTPQHNEDEDNQSNTAA